MSQQNSVIQPFIYDVRNINIKNNDKSKICKNICNTCCFAYASEGFQS